jgi:hypothetical protein
MHTKMQAIFRVTGSEIWNFCLCLYILALEFEANLQGPSIHQCHSRARCLLVEGPSFPQFTRCSYSSTLGLARILNNLCGSPHQFQLVNSSFVQYETRISVLITSVQKRNRLALKIMFIELAQVILASRKIGENPKVISLTIKKISWYFSPQASYTDRATAACRRS